MVSLLQSPAAAVTRCRPARPVPWRPQPSAFPGGSVPAPSHACRSIPLRKGSLLVRSQSDEGGDWFTSVGADRFRSLPLAVGAAGGGALLLNRLLSGTVLVADASSAQSRADVIGVALAATLVLTGLQWKTLEQRRPEAVELDGEEVLEVDASLPAEVQQELRWAWDALRSATRCRGLAVFAGPGSVGGAGGCALKAGVVSRECARGAAPALGPIAQRALESGTGNYLANLVLFPGRAEFSYFPPNAQGVIVQPIGAWGVLVAATDTQRGFSRVDQAWIAALAEKLDVALDA